MLLSLRDSVPAATVEALVEALYAQGQLSSPILPLAGNLMSLQSAREVQELRREVSKLWVALRSLALVGSPPTPPTTQDHCLADEGVFAVAGCVVLLLWQAARQEPVWRVPTNEG